MQTKRIQHGYLALLENTSCNNHFVRSLRVVLLVNVDLTCHVAFLGVSFLVYAQPSPFHRAGLSRQG